MTHDRSGEETLKTGSDRAPVIPDHTLLRCVGRGGYGEVWLARNVLGAFRAVKIVFRKSFSDDRLYAREFTGIEKFEPISRTHPGLVSILHVGRNERDGYFFYIMELADDAGMKAAPNLSAAAHEQTGKPLDPEREILARVTPKTPRSPVFPIEPTAYLPRTLKMDLQRPGRLFCAECLEISLSLASALSHLHQHGLIHRDIKPSNIIFVGGIPKIADIGLVTEIGEAVSFVGTQGYMPPEGPGNPAADVFSLGKVLSELLLKASSSEPLENLAGTEANAETAQLPRLNEIILKASELNVLKRYQSAEELCVELLKLKAVQKSASSRATTGKRKLATILFTDMVGSTKLKQTLGDRDAVALMHQHHTLVREILSQFPDAQEISTAGDSFFLVFVKPSDAVRFALLLQSRLRALNQIRSHPILDRIGIHIGEVVIEEREGALKPRDLYGMQVDTCARVMSLAQGDQILLTRSAFENARQALKGEALPGLGPLSWVSHGLYRLSGVDEPLEICEVAETGKGRISPPPDSEKVQRVVSPVPEPRSTWRSKLTSAAPTTAAWRQAKIGVGVAVILILATMALIPGNLGKLLRWGKASEAKQLAVLPFKTFGDDPTSQEFADGLAETITTKLTQLERFQGSLWVVPMAEVRKEGITGASQAWKTIRTALVLTGSVQRNADQVRLTLNLVDAESLRQLRSSSIDTLAKQVYQLQDSVVREVAKMLDLEFPPAAQKLLSSGQTKVSTAYDLYLQGLGKLARYDQESDLDFAILRFQEALRLDPQYALAYAALGEVHWRKYTITKDKRWIEEARACSSRALELDSLLAPAQVTLGIIDAGTGSYDGATQAFRRALTLDRGNADAYRELALAYEKKGLLKEAEVTLRRAIDLRPNYWAMHKELGTFYIRHGRYPEAESPFRKVIDLTPDNYLGYRNLGGLYSLMGKDDEAILMLNRSLEIKENPQAYSNLGTLYYYQRKYSDAVRVYELALAMRRNERRLWGNLADAYRHTPGMSNKAAEAYQEAIRLTEKNLSVNPRDAEERSSLAVYAARLAETPKALAEIQEACRLAPENVNVLFRSSLVYEQLGDRSRALEALGEALERRYSLAEVEREPDLADLRRHPGYAALRAKISASLTNLKPNP